MSVNKLKGYVSGVDRKACGECVFFVYDINKPKQERKMLCTFIKPSIETDMDAYCDNYKE